MPRKNISYQNVIDPFIVVLLVVVQPNFSNTNRVTFQDVTFSGPLVWTSASKYVSDMRTQYLLQRTPTHPHLQCAWEEFQRQIKWHLLILNTGNVDSAATSRVHMATHVRKFRITRLVCKSDEWYSGEIRLQSCKQQWGKLSCQLLLCLHM